MKGIVLAGGAGSRLHPITLGTSKQLLPVYDKPLIYYPLSVLFLARIRDILIITTPEEQAGFRRLLGDGTDFGVKFSYATQLKPEGLAQAFIIGRDFIGGEPVAMVLGDNIFYGADLDDRLKKAQEDKCGATIFGAYVQNPSCFGVLEFDKTGRVSSIEEKPKNPKSNYAVTGLYFYDKKVCDIASKLKPSKRGELEITDLNCEYLKRGELGVEMLGRGYAWMDAGTADSLLEAGNFIGALEKRQGIQVACLEEIAFNNGWMSQEDLLIKAERYRNSIYGEYLRKIAAETTHV